MPRHRLLPTLLIAAALSLSACDPKVAENDGQTTDPATKTSTGSPEAREHGTAVNDTAPHRPGTPSPP